MKYHCKKPFHMNFNDQLSIRDSTLTSCQKGSYLHTNRSNIELKTRGPWPHHSPIKVQPSERCQTICPLIRQHKKIKQSYHYTITWVNQVFFIKRYKYTNSLPFKKEVTFHLNKLESLHPKMFLAPLVFAII